MGLPRMAWVNALRILDTSLLYGVESLVCLYPRDHVMGQTFGVALAKMRNLDVSWELGNVSGSGVLVVGPANHTGFANVTQGRVVRLHEAEELEAGAFGGKGVGCYDAKSGTLLSLSVEQPVMAKGEEDFQSGWREGGFGHLLNGLSAREESHALIVGGLGDQLESEIQMPGVGLDGRGFLVLQKLAGES